MTIDTSEFRKVMGRFATGVTVVTTCNGQQRQGITVNAFCSVSLDPPLVLICVEKTSLVHEALRRSGFFAVNFLHSGQENLSNCFAGNTDERHLRFCDARSHTVATGAPVLEDTLGYVDCRIVAEYPGGDHTIFLGQVEALEAREGDPLLYFRSQYLELQPQPQPLKSLP